MKFKISILISSLVLTGTCLTSCDFLDIVPSEQAVLEDAFQDPQKSLGFLYSCYSGMNKVSPTSYTQDDVSSSDEYVLPHLWNQFSQRIQWNKVSAALIGDWSWGRLTPQIRQCYIFMDGIQTAPHVTLSQKAEWTAEAEFLIAFYHFAILRQYGPSPIMDRALSPNLDPNDIPGRSHFDYVVEFIIKKLDKAILNLPADRTGSDWGRASQVVAKALKARVLIYAASPLWNGNTDFADWKNKSWETPGYGKELVSQTYDGEKWVKALEACKNALDEAILQGFKLYDKSDFEELKDLEEGPEKEFQKYVLRMRYAVVARANVSDASKEMIWALSDEGNIVTGSLPHRILKKNDGNWISGYSGVAPTFNAVEKFYTKNGKIPAEDPTFFDQSEWFQRANEKSDIVKFNTDREPRYYAWLAFDGGEYGVKLSNGSPIVLDMKNPELHGYNPELFNRDNSQTGFLSQKFIHPRLEYNTSGGSNAADVKAPRPLIRMSELYLNLAEAYVNVPKKNLTAARENLNIVRRRAGVPDLTAADFDKDPMKWVINERFIELYGEGHRFYDIRRWKIAGDVMNQQFYGMNAIDKKGPSFEEFNRKTVILNQKFSFEKRLYILPLYYQEVYKGPHMIQAPGY